MNQAVADDIGKLILRLTLGILLLLHGANKITNGVSGIEGMLQGAGLPAYLAYGSYVGEVLAPLLVILGLYSRVGAFLVVVHMAFAVFLAHRADLLLLGPQGGWALELQGFYFFTALALLYTGPGRVAFNRG